MPVEVESTAGNMFITSCLYLFIYVHDLRCEIKCFIVGRFAFGQGVVSFDSSISQGSSSHRSSRSSRADREAQQEARTKAGEERARRPEELANQANQGMLYMATCLQVFI